MQKQIPKCLIALIFLLVPASQAYAEDGTTPKLVVLLTVDQLRFDYLDRFRPMFNGGLKRLLDEGALFTNAHYEHADTSTCPGHATLATGVHPSRSGIISNGWYDRKSDGGMYCVYDRKYEISPKNLLVTALPDWLREDDRSSRAFSVSAKDRAAVMLGGKRPEGVFWYAKSSDGMVSSQYYKADDRKWVKEFNEQDWLRRYFGKPWTPLTVSEGLLERAGVRDLNYGDFNRSFPHVVGKAEVTPSDSFYSSLYNTPLIDTFIAEFVYELLKQEELGKSDSTDYLGISFSALDTVGHSHGPNSREVVDTVLRLDQIFGKLLQVLHSQTGGRVVVALTSDHGVQPLPEYGHKHGEQGHRQDAVDVACLQAAGAKVSSEFGVGDLFIADFYLNYELLRELDIPMRELSYALRREVEKCRMVDRLWTRAELAAEGDLEIPRLAQFQKSFHPDRSADYMPQLKENHLHTLDRGTGHGSPYAYDSHVPILFWGAIVPSSARISERVSNVDVAPTLAAFAGISVPSDRDGRNLRPLIVANEGGD